MRMNRRTNMRLAARLAALLLVLLAGFAAPMRAEAASDSRARTILSAQWRFFRGDAPAAAHPDFDDRGWTGVTLPHSFNAGDGEDPAYYRGPAWYRRAFEISQIRPDRRLFIQFDGAATAADVYVNGRLAGRHEGGHAAFRFDVTAFVVPGRNVIAVRVDNSASRTIAPLGGDFTLFGGLYRPVSLIETGLVHVDLLDHGGPGVYARTTGVSGDSASVAIAARIANDSRARRRVRVTSRILDAGGREVARDSTALTLAAGATGIAEMQARIAGPRRWDGVRDPYLYRVVTRIGEAGDEVSVPLGIREFRIDSRQGFLLNGTNYPLRGANLMHSARPGSGTAVTEAEIAEDFAILREMGSTGVRLVHFQHPQAAYDEADRLGLAVWTEIGINSAVEDTPAFRANARQQLRELIAQTYNHPSVVLWGIGNEVYSDDPLVARILRELHELVRATDPSRPTVYAHCCQADDHPKAMVTDVIGFNRYFGWYQSAGNTTIGAWADGFHAAHPERAFAVSEYGAGASIRHQEDPPRTVVPDSFWHPEQYQTLYHERNWRELASRTYLFGTFVWVAFDLASAGRNEGDRRGINDKGLVSYDRRTRKDAFYWYQANWSDRPVLYITGRRFTLRHDRAAEVKVYTNGGPVSLWLNGALVGTVAPQDRIARWQVTLREGPNRIEVRNQHGGRDQQDGVEWHHVPAPAAMTDAETGSETGRGR